jgi:hypothetical protein
MPAHLVAPSSSARSERMTASHALVVEKRMNAKETRDVVQRRAAISSPTVDCRERGGQSCYALKITRTIKPI